MATVLVSAPANGLKRVIRRQGEGAGTRRNDEERGRETALRLTARRQFAGVRKAQVTARKRAAHPERMLQACR